MSKARGLADLGNAFNDGALSNRNLIINGAMQVAQRGTSFTADNVFTLDRWKSGDGTGGSPARTLSQETFTLGQTDVPNAHYYLKHDQTTASTNGNSSLIQKVEDVTRFDGQTVTLSFYAKADAAMDVDVRFIQDFGTGGSPSSDVTLTETVSIGTSWAKYTVTKTMGSLSGKTLGTDGVHTSFLSLNFEFQSTSTFTFEGALFQLEYGDTATPFEHRSYGDELAKCQRFFQRFGNLTGNTINGICNLSVRSATDKYAVIHHPVVPRAQPTVGYSSLSHFILYAGASSTTPTAFTYQGTTASGSTEVQINTNSFGSSGWGGWLRLNSSTGYLDFDMEL